MDVETQLALGNAMQAESLDALLAQADVVTLHVPETPLTHNMMGAAEIARMKPGAKLINAARGTVVDIDALAEALKAEHVGAAALDVFLRWGPQDRRRIFCRRCAAWKM